MKCASVLRHTQCRHTHGPTSLTFFMFLFFSLLRGCIFLCLSFFSFYNFYVQWKRQYCCNAGELIEFYKRSQGQPCKLYTSAKSRLRCPDSCMLEKITASPPFCCTDSTSATYFFRNSGLLALPDDENDPAIAGKSDVPEELVGDEQSANSPSICGQLDVFRTIPGSHLIVSKHLKKSARR
jgi:hypothetical protein